MGRKFKDLTGLKVNKLTVLSLHLKRKDSLWLCKCECGKIKIASTFTLKTKAIRSCGCHLKYNGITGHGKYRPLYHVYCGMKKRCNNPKDQAYQRYGGRGITVCKKWNESFIPFFKWSIKNGWVKGLHLDRENNDGNYTAQNCRFVTYEVSQRNKSDNRKIEYNGEIKIITDWAKCLNFSKGLLVTRLNAGWSIEKAFTTPIETKYSHSKSAKDAWNRRKSNVIGN